MGHVWGRGEEGSKDRWKEEEKEEEEEEEAAQLTAALQYTERESETAVFDTPETRD